MRGVLATGLMALVFAGCRTGPPRGPAPDLTAFLTDDTIVVAGIDLDALRATPAVRKLTTERNLPQIEDYNRRTGFDLKDVNDLLIATNGKNAIIAARGNFPANPRNSSQITPYKGYKLYGKPDGAFTFIDRQTALAGPQVAIRGAIDAYAAGTGGHPAVLRLARSLPAAKQLWVVSSVWREVLEDRVPKTGNAGKLARTFGTLRNAAFAADFRNGVDAMFTGEAPGAAEAKDMAETLRGLVSLAHLNVPRQGSDFGRVLDGIHAEEQESNVRITVNVAEPDLEKLMDWLNARVRR